MLQCSYPCLGEPQQSQPLPELTSSSVAHTLDSCLLCIRLSSSLINLLSVSLASRRLANHLDNSLESSCKRPGGHPVFGDIGVFLFLDFTATGGTAQGLSTFDVVCDFTHIFPIDSCRHPTKKSIIRIFVNGFIGSLTISSTIHR